MSSSATARTDAAFVAAATRSALASDPWKPSNSRPRSFKEVPAIAKAMRYLHGQGRWQGRTHDGEEANGMPVDDQGKSTNVIWEARAAAQQRQAPDGRMCALRSLSGPLCCFQLLHCTHQDSDRKS